MKPTSEKRWSEALFIQVCFCPVVTFTSEICTKLVSRSRDWETNCCEGIFWVLPCFWSASSKQQQWYFFTVSAINASGAVYPRFDGSPNKASKMRILNAPSQASYMEVFSTEYSHGVVMTVIIQHRPLPYHLHGHMGAVETHLRHCRNHYKPLTACVALNILEGPNCTSTWETLPHYMYIVACL